MKRDTITCEHWTKDQNWRLKPIQIHEKAGWIKPLGALWMSPTKSEYGWRHFMIQEEMMEKSQSRVILQVDLDNAVVINNVTDLDKLMWKECDFISPSERLVIDFISMLKAGIDCIWLTDAGEYATRFLWGTEHLPKRLSGWDCETVVALHENCILSWCIDPVSRLNKEA